MRVRGSVRVSVSVSVVVRTVLTPDSESPEIQNENESVDVHQPTSEALELKGCIKKFNKENYCKDNAP
jgi:hypothetical protein